MPRSLSSDSKLATTVSKWVAAPFNSPLSSTETDPEEALLEFSFTSGPAEQDQDGK